MLYFEFEYKNRILRKEKREKRVIKKNKHGGKKKINEGPRGRGECERGSQLEWEFFRK